MYHLHIANKGKLSWSLRAWILLTELAIRLSRFGGPFLAGAKFSAVDAFYLPVAIRLQAYQLNEYLSEPALSYSQRLLALPSFAQWKIGAQNEK